MGQRRLFDDILPALFLVALTPKESLLFKQARFLETRWQGPDSRVVNTSVEVKESDSGGRNLNPTIG